MRQTPASRVNPARAQRLARVANAAGSSYRLKSPSLPAVVRDRAESYAWFMIGCHESRQAEAVVKQHSAPHSRKSGSGIS